ncbi:MAG: helix-turn-helix domain-containing protein [Cyanobacteriota bacterium]|nr:helix-turn-helix domain-containing protein [Cyanobacteriota bacterium]
MPRPPKITNEEILAAAREVFLEQGIGASTLDIAERAGISEASIFKRFNTKQALFLAAIGITEKPEWVNRLANETPTANFKAELTDICTQMLAFYQEVLLRVFLLMSQGNFPRRPQVPPPPVRDSQLLAKFLDRAIERGLIRSCNTMALAHAIAGAMANYILTKKLASQRSADWPVSDITVLDSETFVRGLIEALWAGMAPES